MARVRVYYDRQGNTLSVWFADPQQEFICEETGEGIVLMKDREGRVIGFEKLEFATGDDSPLEVGFDAVGV